MLSPRAEAPTANPDGRSAPEVSLDTRTWRCRADTTGHWGRFRREMGLLMLHGDGRQGYSIPGHAPASCGSGEGRFRSRLEERRIVRHWDKIDELIHSVKDSINDFARRRPGIGWIRGDQAFDPKILQELEKLTVENKEL